MTDFLTISHTSRDFTAWKKAYDADAANRALAGLTELLLVRRTDDANTIGLIFSLADRAKAKAFLTSDRLRQAMAGAGIVGVPEMTIRHGDYQPNTSSTFLALNCKVSSFDTFRAGYAMDAADRKAASLTDLGVMQNVDNPNDLFVIWAVGDPSRAHTFLNSPKLIEHQTKNAGLVGRPDAHFWKR
jgi:hypothetical protein